MSKEFIFLLGGARSGKSRYAQELAAAYGKKVLFVATAEPRDEEMKARIEAHRRDRPASWRTLELPAEVAHGIEKHIGNAEVIIIDCLTLLAGNILCENPDLEKGAQKIINEVNELSALIDRTEAVFILISNEIGCGIVPENRMARVFRDAIGQAHQIIARNASKVYLMVAGIPVKIKG